MKWKNQSKRQGKCILLHVLIVEMIHKKLCTMAPFYQTGVSIAEQNYKQSPGNLNNVLIFTLYTSFTTFSLKVNLPNKIMFIIVLIWAVGRMIIKRKILTRTIADPNAENNRQQHKFNVHSIHVL